MMKKQLLLLIFFAPFISLAQDALNTKQRQKLIKKNAKTSDFVYLKGGSFNLDVSYSYNLTSYVTKFQGATVDQFFICKYELTNKEYLSYIDSLKKLDTAYANDQLPDTLVWRQKNSNSDLFVEYYLRHPAYVNYPIVGVSYNKAQRYLEWRTKQYNSNPDRVFKKVKFRLPTEREWIYAAKGDNNYALYPWKKQREMTSSGQEMANFHYVSQASIYRDSTLKKNYLGETYMIEEIKCTGEKVKEFNPSNLDGLQNDIDGYTMAVDAFKPNVYGLYNMGGNVEEMVDAFYHRTGPYIFSHGEEPAKDPSGVTKGGSWNDTGGYVQNYIRQFYPSKDYTSNEIGMRLVMEVIEY